MNALLFLNNPVALWIFLVSLPITAFVGAICMKLRSNAREAQLRSSFEPELAMLSERLRLREENLSLTQQQLFEKDRELNQQREENSKLRSHTSELQTAMSKDRQSSEEKLQLLRQNQEEMINRFKALSSDALKSNNLSFLELAQSALQRFQEGAAGDLEKRQLAIDHLVKPVKESLEKFDIKVGELEKSRIGAYERLTQQVDSLKQAQEILKTEASNLVRALGTPRVRGRWGEIQLKRVVELAGMIDHCDFEEQTSVTTEDGRLRPDMIVRLPGKKIIVVDAKAPLAAYLEALEVTDDLAKEEKLRTHARHIRDHMTLLSRKSYWEQFDAAPEFVVLFLPGENFFSAALQLDPALIEEGVNQRVILATPTTLISLLKAVSYGWRQERLAENAEEICKLGNELYKRICDMAGHLQSVGGKLDQAVLSYNKAVGSLETRVLVSARRFKELEASTGDLEVPLLEPLDTTTRVLQSEELCNRS